MSTVKCCRDFDSSQIDELRNKAFTDMKSLFLEDIAAAIMVLAAVSWVPSAHALVGTNLVNGNRWVELSCSVDPNWRLSYATFEYGLTKAYAATNGPFTDGLGGDTVTFELNEARTGALNIEFSTNLIDWQKLGPAQPLYKFNDTNAPSTPRRFYRLSAP